MNETINSILDTEIMGTTLREVVSLEYLLGLGGDILAAALILMVGFMIAGWANRRVSSIGGRNKHLDPTLFNFLGNIAKYAVIVFTFLIVLNTFGVQTTSFVAIIGAAGLAIGLALQGTLSNVAAGVMLVFFRPIKQGDFVEISGETGTVKAITLNFTELATVDNVQVIIPNSQVWGNTITNYSVHDTRRAEWTFGVGYGSDLQKAEQIIREAVTSDPRALSEPAPWMQVTNLGDSSVDFTVRVWCASSDFWDYKADMTRKVKEALDAGGIDIPYPTRTVISESAD